MSMAITVVLPAPSGEFQCQAEKLRMRFVAGVLQVFEKCVSGLTHLRRDFGEPDRDFRGFDLAEERPDAGEGMGPPVFQ
jgi:hypothetical protein